MKLPWQQLLKNELEHYKKTCETQELLISEQNKRIAILQKFADAPPTVMIACERIVDASAQLACTANAMMKEARR